jgi:hypothetical protein
MRAKTLFFISFFLGVHVSAHSADIFNYESVTGNGISYLESQDINKETCVNCVVVTDQCGIIPLEFKCYEQKDVEAFAKTLLSIGAIYHKWDDKGGNIVEMTQLEKDAVDVIKEEEEKQEDIARIDDGLIDTEELRQALINLGIVTESDLNDQIKTDNGLIIIDIP